MGTICWEGNVFGLGVLVWNIFHRVWIRSFMNLYKLHSQDHNSRSTSGILSPTQTVIRWRSLLASSMDTLVWAPPPWAPYSTFIFLRVFGTTANFYMTLPPMCSPIINCNCEYIRKYFYNRDPDKCQNVYNRKHVIGRSSWKPIKKRYCSSWHPRCGSTICASAYQCGGALGGSRLVRIPNLW